MPPSATAPLRIGIDALCALCLAPPPGKMAALGRLDLSPRAVVISIAAGALLLVGVLATGARAERIGATLDVPSVPGRGTSVILTLPMPPSAAAATSKNRAPLAVG